MTLTTAIALLQAALSLLTFVSGHPELGQSARDQATQVSEQAIRAATLALQAPPASLDGEAGSVAGACPSAPKPSCTNYVPIRNTDCTIGFQCVEQASGMPAQTGATPAVQGASCATPWGGKTIASGETISSQPYFTRGQYSGTVVVPLMRCANGAWMQCDWQGNSCHSYVSI